jgi:hypothetical protein
MTPAHGLRALAKAMRDVLDIADAHGPNRATASFTPVSTFADLRPDGCLRGA